MQVLQRFPHLGNRAESPTSLLQRYETPCKFVRIRETRCHKNEQFNGRIMQKVSSNTGVKKAAQFAYQDGPNTLVNLTEAEENTLPLGDDGAGMPLVWSPADGLTRGKSKKKKSETSWLRATALCVWDCLCRHRRIPHRSEVSGFKTRETCFTEDGSRQ